MNLEDNRIKEIILEIRNKRFVLVQLKARKRDLFRQLNIINRKIDNQEEDIMNLATLPAKLTECETCKSAEGIEPKIKWGKRECQDCRIKTGECLKCGKNRNDCSC